ncbi:unnamed protein product [Bursaphelenchus okinawaensis]|uniref:Major facilitator superfamily (MFS) profile domain-containing protein n=1 Tax=Bursaphelenchus okinawaensis TaxID=465554 RepID=A0A811L5Q9_9BILA|nr:unnamed protein product [Bursaphelenchus okinawaensis]CAG9118228.1 unnamed protein product [Bursaphelenchus okinawaensis]
MPHKEVKFTAQDDEDEVDQLTPQAIREAFDDNEELKNLGDFIKFGRYTIFIIILYELMLLPQMANMTFMIYGGYAPKVVQCGHHDYRNLSTVKSCAAFKADTAASNCSPVLETQFNSLAYEFNYYCDRIIDVKRTISIMMLGVLFGAIIFGQLSDSFGRKKMMIITHLGMLTLDLIASRATSLEHFTLIQFFTSLFVGGHNTIMHVFLLENIPKKHRVWVSCMLSYSPNYIIVAGIAYLAEDWRMLIRIAGLLNIPAFFLLLFAFESPRWLIQKAYLDSARTTLMKMEKINGTATPIRIRNIDRLIEQEIIQNETKKSRRKYYFYHLFYTWKMCLYTAIISYALLATSIISYALIFNMEHLSGSIFVSTAFFGAFRWAVNLTVGAIDYFVPKAGRKPIHNGALSFILAMLAIVIAIKSIGIQSVNLTRITTMSAAAMCSQLFMVNAIVTSELFPTAIRNLAVSFVQISSRLGGVISPHVFYLANIWEPLPFVFMFTIMAINAIMFGVFIPETKGSSMIDHMPDKSKRIWKSRKQSLQGTNIQPSVAKLTEDV